MSSRTISKFKDWVGDSALEMRHDRHWWVFGWNNPTDIDAPKKLKDLMEVWWQLEEGTVRHTPHLQGVCRFLYPKGIGELREQIPCWWHVMCGTVKQAVDYNTKDHTRIAGPWHHHALTPFFSTLEAIMAKPIVWRGPTYQPFIGPLLEGQGPIATECFSDKPFHELLIKPSPF